MPMTSVEISHSLLCFIIMGSFFIYVSLDSMSMLKLRTVSVRPTLLLLKIMFNLHISAVVMYICWIRLLIGSE